jgi:hypothetical protein
MLIPIIEPLPPHDVRQQIETQARQLVTDAHGVAWRLAQQQISDAYVPYHKARYKEKIKNYEMHHVFEHARYAFLLAITENKHPLDCLDAALRKVHVFRQEGSDTLVVIPPATEPLEQWFARIGAS